MASFGEELRQERESRGVSLGEIAERTKIGSSHLKALENNDFASLPGRVFAKGYVRAYCDFLGLDPDPLVEAYDREERSQEEEGKLSPPPDLLDGLRHAVPARGSGEWSRRVPWGLVLGGAAIVILALVGWWTLRPGTEPATPSRVASADTAPAKPTTPEPQPVEPEPQPRPSEVGADEPKSVPPPQPKKTTPAKQPAPPTREPVVAAREASPKPVEPEPVVRTPVVTEPIQDLEPPTITIPEFGVGSEVVNRKLEGRSDRFAEGSRVCFWTRVVGGGPDRPIRHVWLHEGRVVDTIELKIGASHWRTYSRETLRLGTLGAWAVEARDAEGRVLAREEFLCVPGGTDGSELATTSESTTAAS